MPSSLLPERAVSFSPSLAVTLGLEEAVMLQGLQELVLHSSSNINVASLNWVHADHGRLHTLFPFWQDTDIERITNSLVEKGVVLLKSAPYAEVRHLYFAFNVGNTTQAAHQASVTQPVSAAASSDSPSRGSANKLTSSPQTHGKSAITADWQPDNNTLVQIQQHGIDPQFSQKQLPEFVSYWLQRGETAYAWGNKFQKHVLREWRRHEAQANQGSSIQQQWSPSEDALEILHRIDISPEFIEDAVPEFVLYWRERGESTNSWNSKFLIHIKRQWARYNAALEYDSEPHLIPANWQPRTDVYDILALANIDLGFAKQQIPEFILFWTETHQLHASWNTKFLQHVKYRWAKQHQFNGQESDARQQRPNAYTSGKSQGKKSTFEQLTDRSWANGA